MGEFGKGQMSGVCPPELSAWPLGVNYSFAGTRVVKRLASLYAKLRLKSGVVWLRRVPTAW